MMLRTDPRWPLGPQRIPVLPPVLGLTDRDTGVVWYLSHQTGGNRISILDSQDLVETAPRNFRDFIIYPAFEEPYVEGDPLVRILVRNGHLGYEYGVAAPAYITANNAAPLLTRRKNQRILRQIIHGASFKLGGHLSWLKVHE